MRNPDICKHIGLPPHPEVQAAYDAWKASEEETKRLGDAWSEAVAIARKKQPVLDRLVFAARERCICGAGMAYDQGGPSGQPYGYWDCSAILLGQARMEARHSARIPFAFYSVRAEGQPSAYGETTRPQEVHK